MLLGKGGDLHFGDNNLLKLAARIGYRKYRRPHSPSFSSREIGLPEAVVMPLPHEIRLDGAAGGFVVLHGAVFPDRVDHRLPILFRQLPCR